MITKIHHTLLLIVSTLFLVSCNENQEEDHTFEQLTLNYYEQFEQDSRSIIFSLETLDQFPCSNFIIHSDVIRNDNQIEIVTNNIELPNTCINEIGPATRVINLGEPQQIPVDFIVWVNDQKHNFQLLKKENQYILQKEDFFSENLFFERDTLQKIPDHTIWGYIVEDHMGRIDFHDDFLNYLKQNNIDITILPDGDYYHFAVTNEELFINVGEKSQKGFSISYQGNLEDIVKLFNKYLIAQDKESWKIRLFSTNGERYLM